MPLAARHSLFLLHGTWPTTDLSPITKVVSGRLSTRNLALYAHIFFWDSGGGGRTA